MSDLTEVRSQAWRTRRVKYGEKGHSGSYSRGPHHCSACDRMQRVIASLHLDELLTEGQAAKATGLDRVVLRTLADDIAAERETLRRRHEVGWEFDPQRGYS